MALFLAPVCQGQAIDVDGNPRTGGKIYTYLADTSTPTATYTTEAGSTPHANPIILNSLGQTPNPIWITSGLSYKFVETDSADVVIRTIDNIDGVNDTTQTASEWFDSGFTPTYISAVSFSVPGDQTSTLQIGRRLKTTNTGGAIYSTITNSVYGALTTVTVTNDSGTLDAGLSVVAYGLLSATNPSVPATYAKIASPTFTGTPSAPTAAAATNTTQLATTAFVQQEVPAASTTAAGKAELLTTAEGVTGTDGTRIMTAAVMHASKSVLGTLTASTSGTAINFTGIPAWTKRITVMFNAMSTSGTSPPTVRIGDSGGIEATGYLGTTLTFANASPVGSVSSTTGFDLSATNAGASVYHGSIVITLMDAATNLWVCSGVVNRSDAGAGATLGYNKTLSATLDRVQITTNNGTDTFDAGSVNILYE